MLMNDDNDVDRNVDADDDNFDDDTDDDDDEDDDANNDDDADDEDFEINANAQHYTPPRKKLNVSLESIGVSPVSLHNLNAHQTLWNTL